MSDDIYEYVKQQENAFQTEQVRLGDNWNWSFRDHVQLIFHLKNSIFYTGENNWLRAFKNIMEPMLNLAYWTEDIEVKDVVFYIEEKSGRALSFLVKKYYEEVYVKENNLDTLFDEITESDVDYGGVLVQKTNEARPEVFAMNSIAFCDQTDVLGGPIAFKHNFSPDKLRTMAKLGWGDKSKGATASIEEVIALAEESKDPAGMAGQTKNKTTGKNIETIILRGSVPEHYLKDNDNMRDYYNQVHIICFYYGKNNEKCGVTLYRMKEEEGNLKFHTSQKIYGRALGRGGGEALLHPQIWTNFLTIHKMNLLESAAKTPLYTDDQTYTQKNKIQDMENLEITTIEDGKKIYQVPTAATANIQLIEKSVNDWYEFGQLAGSAFDPLMGKESASGTTFRGQNQVVQQGRGMHDRRRGQRAKFIEEIHRDWIIPDIVNEITKGKEFLATLSSEEMGWVSDRLADNHANRVRLDSVLAGEIPEDADVLRQEFLKDFFKKGNKHLFQILKDEFKGVEIKMGINISGKQKDLSGLSDKVLSIIQFVMANPASFQQAMQIPGMSGAFQDILEYSGLNQADFASLSSLPPPPPPVQGAPAAQGAPSQLLPQAQPVQ